MLLAFWEGRKTYFLSCQERIRGEVIKKLASAAGPSDKIDTLERARPAVRSGRVDSIRLGRCDIIFKLSDADPNGVCLPEELPTPRLRGMPRVHRSYRRSPPELAPDGSG